MAEVRLMTLDPGHFHAALVQKEMYAGVSPRVDVYAPLAPDLLAHLSRIAAFNTRAASPTAWELEIHAGPDSEARLLKERPGNVVVLSGKNDRKMARIHAAVNAGLNVLADKPWVLTPDQLPMLEEALDTAERKGLVALDIMTERHEITSLLQRELVNDREVFGEPVTGSEREPGVFMESVHYLCKLVAGQPLRRPPWFFDVRQQGEGLTDVGTHLVDLVPWMLFPGQGIDQHKEVELRTAKRWPTVMSRTDFQRVTGESEFPAYLRPQIEHDKLNYFCNTQVGYKLRGIHVRLNILWDFEASAGSGDTHLAVFRGTRARVEVRQGKEQNFRPELYVVANDPGQRPATHAALDRKVRSLAGLYPGLGIVQTGVELQVTIPDSYRIGHEAHFAQVTGQFLQYLKDPRSLPVWEKANMLAKYAVTTRGVELSQEGRSA